MKKNVHKLIEIFVTLYRLTVVIAWETDLREVLKFCQKRCSLTEKEIQEIAEYGEEANGITVNLGEYNTDILIWLKKRPKKASEYGNLYHELHHATFHIAKSHNLNNEMEAQAYLYEYLATQANQYFWKKK